MSTTIETITVTRPMKVIAFTLCTITVALLVAAVSASDWVNSGAWREGLFAVVVEKGAKTPLPFGQLGFEGIFPARGAGYIRGTAALLILALMTDFFGTLLTGLGLRSTDPNKKYKYYRVAIYSLLVAVIFLFLAVIIYPVSFSKDIKKVNDDGVTVNSLPLDGYEVSRRKDTGDDDFDNDGIPNAVDPDDDNDGIVDELDPDDDGDNIPDDIDDDDDNDGIKDDQEMDVDVEDSDGDGVLDVDDDDDDGDGIPDHADDDDDGDGVPDNLDPDEDDADDDDDVVDTDGDGTPDHLDGDDDGDGILDVFDTEGAGATREFSWGFGYGCSWACLIFIFISVVLLICDRESEEIFYKERPVEEEGEEEEEA